MRTVFFDTEVYRDLFIVSSLEDGRFRDFIFHKDVDEKERAKLLLYWNELHAQDEDGNCPNIIVGFNTIRYDNPVLHFFLGKPKDFSREGALQAQSLAELHEYSQRLISSDRGSLPLGWVYASGDVDLYKFYKSTDGLKALSARNKAPSLVETNVPFDVESTSAEEVKDILEYCHNDVILTKNLFENEQTQGTYHSRVAIAKLFPLHWAGAAFSNTNAGIAELCVHSLITKGSGTKPPKLTGTVEHNFSDIVDERIAFQTPELQTLLKDVKSVHWTPETKPSWVVYLGNLKLSLGEGGIHGALKNNNVFVHKASDEGYVLDIDVASYYPSLFESLKIPLTHYANFYEAFATLKKLRKDAGKKSVEGMAYKLIANSVTGKLNAPGAIFYDPKAYHTMTINGQLILTTLAEELHLKGVRIIQVNTDGVSVQCNESIRSVIDAAIKDWEKKWGLTMERSEYDEWLQSDVNNYIAFQSGVVKKAKGGTYNGFNNPEMGSKPSIVAKMITEHLLRGTPLEKITGVSEEYLWWSSASGDRTWVIQDGECDQLNRKGVNRLFYAKKGLSIGTVNDETQKYVSKASDVPLGLANTSLTIETSNVDKSVYVRHAQEAINDMHFEEGSYIAAIHYNEYEETEEGREVTKLLKKKLKKLKVLSKGVRGICPDVNCEGHSRDGIASFWRDSMHCFKCGKFFNEAIIDALYSQPIAEPAIQTPLFTEPPRDVSVRSGIPDVVWYGAMGEMADIVGMRNKVTLAAILATFASLTVDRGATRYATGSIKQAMYLLLVAPTGTGKQLAGDIQEAALRSITGKDAMRRLAMNAMSGQGLIDATYSAKEVESGTLDEKGKADKEWVYTTYPTHFVFNEFISAINSGKMQGSTLDAKLCEIYDLKGKYFEVKMAHKAASKRGSATLELDRVDVTLFGALTPEAFQREMLSEDKVAGGLINRCLTIYTDSVEQFLFFETRGKKAWWADMGEIVHNIAHNGVSLTGDVKDFFSEEMQKYAMHPEGVYFQHAQSHNAGTTQVLHKRVGDQFIRLCLLYMLVNGRKSITSTDIDAADWIMRYHIASLDFLAAAENNTALSQNYNERRFEIEQKVVAYLARVGEPRSARDIRTALQRSKIHSKEITDALAANPDRIKSANISAPGGQVKTLYSIK